MSGITKEVRKRRGKIERRWDGGRWRSTVEEKEEATVGKEGRSHEEKETRQKRVRIEGAAERAEKWQQDQRQCRETL